MLFAAWIHSIPAVATATKSLSRKAGFYSSQVSASNWKSLLSAKPQWTLLLLPSFGSASYSWIRFVFGVVSTCKKLILLKITVACQILQAMVTIFNLLCYATENIPYLKRWEMNCA